MGPGALTMRIRPFEPSDAPSILGLVPRFAEGALPPWRTEASVAQFTEASLAAATSALPESSALLVAEAPEGPLAGFIHLQSERDPFTGEAVGYVSELAVAPAFEGQGLGRALMAAGEAWSRARGHRLLTLYVFAGNEGAKALYAKAGFEPEVLKLVKPL